MITITQTQTMIDKALSLVGKMVTDGTVCGVLDSVDGETWSITSGLPGEPPFLHNHTGHPIPEYAEPWALVVQTITLEGYDRCRHTDYVSTGVSLMTLRPGVSLVKPEVDSLPVPEWLLEERRGPKGHGYALEHNSLSSMQEWLQS